MRICAGCTFPFDTRSVMVAAGALHTVQNSVCNQPRNPKHRIAPVKYRQFYQSCDPRIQGGQHGREVYGRVISIPMECHISQAEGSSTSQNFQREGDTRGSGDNSQAGVSADDHEQLAVLHM